MRTPVLFVVLACLTAGAAAALQLPTQATVKEWHRQAVGGIVGGAIGMATAFSALVAPAHAEAEVVKINVDVPALIQVGKDNKEVLFDLAKKTAETVQISRLPQNILEFVRDAAAGDVLLNINGIPLDVSIAAQKGGIDVAASSDKGDISLSLASQYIPKLPLLYKRYVLPEGYEGIQEEVARLEKAAAVDESVPPTPLLDQKFFLTPEGQEWTNKQVLGTTSLGVGAAYASTYAYYINEKEQAEKEAEEKKKAMAAKRKAAAAASKPAKSKAEKSPPKKSEKKKAPKKASDSAAAVETETKKFTVAVEEGSPSATEEEEEQQKIKDGAKIKKTEQKAKVDVTEEAQKTKGVKVTKVAITKKETTSVAEEELPSEFTTPVAPTPKEKKERKRRFFGLVPAKK